MHKNTEWNVPKILFTFIIFQKTTPISPPNTSQKIAFAILQIANYASAYVIGHCSYLLYSNNPIEK